MWNLKYDTNELIYETETDSQTQIMNLWLPSTWGWRDGMEFGISGCKLLNTQWLDNKVLTVYREDIFREIYSVSWDNHNGKIQKKNLYMCNLVTLLCSRN